MVDSNMSRTRRILAGLAGAALATMLTSCVSSIPVDPEDTLESVRNGQLQVGISPNSDFVKVDGKVPQGSEIELVEGFSKRLDASIKWTVAGEEQLVALLEAGELDLVAGGITAKTPWLEKVGVTRPYTTAVGVEGKEQKIVLLVPPGENALLSELEHYLDQTLEMP